MDLADRSEMDSTLHLNLALKQRKPSLTFTGTCHFCNDKIKEGHFCDTDCRDDFEKLQRNK